MDILDSTFFKVGLIAGCACAVKIFTGAARYYCTSTNGGVRMRSRVFTGALMAENVRSPFDYREPPTLDSDGDGGKPPPPRGLVKNPFSVSETGC